MRAFFLMSLKSLNSITSPKGSIARTLKAVLGVAAFIGAFAAFADAVPPGTDDDIRARLAPSGSLCRAGDPCSGVAAAGPGAVASSGPKSGEQVYDQFCFACHAAGVGGAPLFADAEAWAPRLDKGIDTLYASTINGIGMMPAKGTCMDCSDDELNAAVDYMVGQL
ncbi:MAG: c-type cytochrome [Pseudomonadota bacterium]